jgi:hypothetical protein
MTDHRDPDTIPLSERIETAVSNHVLRACYIEMAKRLEAAERTIVDLLADDCELSLTLGDARKRLEALEERERARGGRPKKEAA